MELHQFIFMVSIHILYHEHDNIYLRTNQIRNKIPILIKTDLQKLKFLHSAYFNKNAVYTFVSTCNLKSAVIHQLYCPLVCINQ